MLLCREGNLEHVASFTSAAWEDRGSTSAMHARDALSEHYAPLVYHGGCKLAGTTQISASRAFVFAGGFAALPIMCAEACPHKPGTGSAAVPQATVFLSGPALSTSVDGHAIQSDPHKMCPVMAVGDMSDHGCAGVELRGLQKRGETLSKLYTWALSLHREGTTWLIDGVEQLLGM